MQKIKEWLRRYLRVEILGAIGAILGASLFYQITNNKIIAAYAGTIGENIGYYGFISLRDIKANKIKAKNILILGATFKPNITDTRNSKVEDFIKVLKKYKL